MASSTASTTMHSTFTSSIPGGKVNVIDYIIMRHQELERNMKELANTMDYDRRKTLLDQVVHDLSIHTAVEEQVVYSVMRKEFAASNPDAFDEGVLESFEEHHAAKTILNELNSVGVRNERFQAKARVLYESVLRHMKKEEDHFLPEIRRVIPKERLMQMGEDFCKAEKDAPTRPHLMLPQEGKLGAAAQSAAAMVDKVRDTVSKAK